MERLRHFKLPMDKKREQFNFTNLKGFLAIKQWLRIGPINQSLDPLVRRE